MSDAGKQPGEIDLDAFWKELESKGEDRFWNALRLPVSGERSVLLVLDTFGVRHLLVPAARRRYSTNANSPLSLTVGEHSFTFIDGTTEAGRYVDISCSSVQLYSQFDTVIQSIYDELEESDNLAETAVRVVSRWRELFSYLSSARVLTTQEKLGAFAELLVVENLIDLESFAVECWTGPLGEPHDFELPTCSVEVKAIGPDSRTISIHGLSQLEAVDQKPLTVLIIELSPDASGLSLGELLDRIAIGSPYEHEIRRRAASAGIFRSNGDDDRFIVRGFAHAHVDENFPRLRVSGNLDPSHADGFSNVRYDIAISTLTDRLIHQDELDMNGILDGQL